MTGTNGNAVDYFVDRHGREALAAAAGVSPAMIKLAAALTISLDDIAAWPSPAGERK